MLKRPAFLRTEISIRGDWILQEILGKVTWSEDEAIPLRFSPGFECKFDLVASELELAG